MLRLIDDAATKDELIAKFHALKGEFNTLAVTDLVKYGRAGFNGAPGLLLAIKEFVTTDPDWFVQFPCTPNMTGVDPLDTLVLSRNQELRPKEVYTPYPVGHGPGTELMEIMLGIGIEPSNACSCHAIAEYMDELGPDGSKDNAEQILKLIQDNYHSWGWKEKITASLKGAFVGLANLYTSRGESLDPLKYMFYTAIISARIKGDGR